MTQTHVDGASAEQREPLQVRRARPAEKEQILATIARAFDDDPFVNWAVAQDKRRAARVYEFMAMAYRIHAPHNEIYTIDGVPGAAFWAPPGKGKLNPFQQLRLIPMMRSAVTLRRIPSVSKTFAAVEKKHPDEPHWYLSVLGVEPDSQGQGIGTALMRPVLEMCDRDGTLAYLESSKEQNVPLYERNGFTVTEIFQIPDGPPIWLMRREPR